MSRERLSLFTVCVIGALCVISCGQSNDTAGQSSQKPLSDYAAQPQSNTSTPTPASQASSSSAVGNTSSQQPSVAATAGTDQTPPPVDVASAPQTPTQKTYMFRGNLLLPPDLSNGAKPRTIQDTNVCGVLSLDQANAEKFCFKFEELHNHLYDADHVALDVWDVRDNWYLLLTQKDHRELWVDKTKFGVYHPYADIINQKLLFLGDWNYKVDPTWPLQAYDGPGGNVIELSKDKYPTMKSKSPMLMITSVSQSPNKELWFKINLVNNLCETRKNDSLSPVVMDIWYPAYRKDESGLFIPTVWYFAKGC